MNKANQKQEEKQFSVYEIMERFSSMQEDTGKRLKEIEKFLEEVRNRLFGTDVGFAQEVVTLSHLKAGCPYDSFSEEEAARHGTDILAFVREGGMEIGKISVSVKRTKAWSSEFLDQLDKNIPQDKSEWGILVTTAFPREALNDAVWTTYTKERRMVLIVKPQFATIAYYAIREIVKYQFLLRRELVRLEIIGEQKLDCRGNLNED